jgi:hypothetical protein
MNKNEILVSYRTLIKFAKTLNNYNFRDYFLRKIPFDYRNKKNFDLNEETQKIQELKRIIAVQNLYSSSS